MSSVQQAPRKRFEFIGTPLLVHFDATSHSPNQALGANCLSVIQIMIRRMWIVHSVRVPVFPANCGVTDGGRARYLRSHKEMIRAQEQVEARLRRERIAVRLRSRSSPEKTGDGVIWTECSSRMKAEETRNGQAGYRLRRHLAPRRAGDVSKGRPQVTNVLSFGKRVRAGNGEDL